MLLNSRLQRTVGQILQSQINAGTKILSMVRRFDTGNIFNRTAESIFQYSFGACFTRQPMVKGELEALLSIVINIRKTNEMSGYFACRVITSIFPQRMRLQSTWCARSS